MAKPSELHRLVLLIRYSEERTVELPYKHSSSFLAWPGDLQVVRVVTSMTHGLFVDVSPEPLISMCALGRYRADDVGGGRRRRRLCLISSRYTDGLVNLIPLVVRPRIRNVASPSKDSLQAIYLRSCLHLDLYRHLQVQLTKSIALPRVCSSLASSTIQMNVQSTTSRTGRLL